MATIITDDQFKTEVLEEKSMPVLVDFYADWCGPCQSLAPIVEELAKDMKDKAKVVKVNVDDSPEYAGKYGVMSIPSIKIFKNGKIVEEMVGVQQKDVLIEKLNAHM